VIEILENKMILTIVTKSLPDHAVLEGRAFEIQRCLGLFSENERPSESLDQETEQAHTGGHHWIIQPAVGPVSDRSCQKCGEVREFKNSMD
jgi:hypothetical protein